MVLLNILSKYFVFVFSFFNIAAAYAATDGRRGFEINGVTIPPLFPDILPIALPDSGYLLSSRTQRGSRSLKEFRKWYTSVQLLKKLNALGHLPPHRFLLNNTIEHPALLLQVNKTPRNVFSFCFWQHQEAHKKEVEQLAKMQSADWTSNYFASLIRNLLTVFALTLAPCSWLIIGARQRLGKGRTQHRVAIFPGGNMSCMITFIITSTSNANGGTEKKQQKNALKDSGMWSL